jgi:hypothetical protein
LFKILLLLNRLKRSLPTQSRLGTILAEPW